MTTKRFMTKGKGSGRKVIPISVRDAVKSFMPRQFRLRKMWSKGDLVRISTEEPMVAHMFMKELRREGEYHRLGTDLEGLATEVMSIDVPARRATLKLLEGYGRAGLYIRDFPLAWLQPPAWYGKLTADQMQATIDYQHIYHEK